MSYKQLRGGGGGGGGGFETPLSTSVLQLKAANASVGSCSERNSSAAVNVEIIRIKRRRTDILPGVILLDVSHSIHLPPEKRGRKSSPADYIIDRFESSLNITRNLGEGGHLQKYKRLASFTISQEMAKKTKTMKDDNDQRKAEDKKKEEREGGGVPNKRHESKRLRLALTRSDDKNADYETLRAAEEAGDSDDVIIDLYEKTTRKRQRFIRPGNRSSSESEQSYDDLDGGTLDRRGVPPILTVYDQQYLFGHTTEECDEEDEEDKDDSNAEGYYQNEYPTTPASTSSSFHDGMSEDIERYEADYIEDGYGMYGDEGVARRRSIYTFGSTSEPSCNEEGALVLKRNEHCDDYEKDDSLEDDSGGLKAAHVQKGRREWQRRNDGRSLQFGPHSDFSDIEDMEMQMRPRKSNQKKMGKMESSDHLDNKCGHKFLADENGCGFDSSADPAVDEDIFGNRF